MWHGSTAWVWCDSHNLNLSNRPVRTRMPGGVAGERPMKAAPYADCVNQVWQSSMCEDAVARKLIAGMFYFR
jgi:hypothetical protein